MGSFTDSFANHALEDLVGTASNIALFTADPTDSGLVSSEVGTGVSYDRVDSTGTWAAAASRAKSTSGSVSFPEATGSWGTVSHMALCVSGTESTTDLKLHGSLSSSKVIETGDQIVFKSGSITLSIAAG